MKKSSAILFVFSLLLFGFANKVNAQQKIGCINSNELITAMPENATAQAAINSKTDELVKQSQELQAELGRKYELFLQQQDSLSLLIKQTKQAEIADMQKNVENFNAAADQELANFRQEIYQPILDKAKNAIKEVANEGGFTYILDTGTGALAFFPEEAPLDILAAVKAKLGIE